MKLRKSISIRQKIYWSFSLLVFLFVINGIITIFTINNNKKLSSNILEVVTPSIREMDGFNEMMLESKMYTTNWVFLRANGEDKISLEKIHDSGYAALKSRINIYSAQWADNNWVDSLNKVYKGFEELLVIEKSIMNSLKEFTDYDNPVIKLEAERKVEEEILPRTTVLMSSLKTIQAYTERIRSETSTQLAKSTMKLRMLIIILTITIILAGFLFSVYMTKAIITPFNRIRKIINNLGQGIIQKIDHPAKNDEIGQMVQSVNNLSEKLQTTAIFAQQVGMRNFDMPFKPISDADILGKALINMRDSIQSSDEKLNEAQHIARLGSWERDIETDKMLMTDEMFNIFDIDPLSFEFQFQSLLDLVHPDDISNVRETMRKNRYMAPMPFECRIITPKGIIKHVLIETKVVLGKNGEIEKTFGIAQDITERKKSQQQVEAVNREFNILFNSIDEVFFSVNMVSFKVIQISATCEKLYGYPQSDFLANPRLWFDLIHPEDKHLIEDEDEQLRKGEQVNNQYRVICKDKTIRWIETKITPTLDEYGKLLRIDGVTSNISQRKKAEEELIQKERYNRNLFDQSPVGLALARMDGSLEDVNEAYAKITGHTIEEIKRMSYYEITPQKYSEQEAEQLKYLELTGRYGPYEKEYIHKNGHLVPVSLSGNILEKDGVKYIWSSVEDITERKRSEIEVVKAEERYRNIVETAQEGIWMIDENLKTTFVNKKICEMLGYSSSEMMGKDLFHFMDEGGKSIATDSLARQKQDGVDHLDFKFLTKDGAVVWAYLATSSVIDDNGNYVGGLAMVTDITERKNNEEKLAAKQLSLNEAQAIAHVGNWEIELATDAHYWSDEIYKIFGICIGEVEPSEKAFMSFFHPDDLNEANNKIQEGFNTYQNITFEFRFIRKDGMVRYGYNEWKFKYDKNNNPQWLTGIFQDITERKLAIESLQQSEMKYRQIVETAQEGIWMIDEDNYTIFINKKMSEMLEYTVDEMMGKKNYCFMDDEWKKIGANHIVSRKLGKNETHDFKYITKSGKDVWTSLSTNPVFDDSGKYKGALAMVTDITQRKLDEEQLQQSEMSLAFKNKELEHKNKELEQFAYVASHDLQEPLRTTSSFVELLQKQYHGQLDAKADKYLTYISQSSDRMKTLINDLLDYSRIGNKRELEQVDCNIIMQEVLEDLGKTIGDEEAAIKTEQLPVVSGYRMEIKQLFQNLVVNAIKFRKKGTKPEISISARKGKSSWIFAVRDNGIGIALEHQDRIFSIFQRLHTRAEYEGSGIGLAHCKKIAGLHGGKIWVESAPGEGSTFYFSIPIINTGAGEKLFYGQTGATRAKALNYG